MTLPEPLNVDDVVMTPELAALAMLEHAAQIAVVTLLAAHSELSAPALHNPPPLEPAAAFASTIIALAEVVAHAAAQYRRSARAGATF